MNNGATVSKRKKVKYTAHPSFENGLRSMDSIGAELGLSKNRISQLFAGAMKTVADSVFREIRGRKPNEEELERLSKDESFQLLVSEVMSSTQSNEDRVDP